jgi:hypothetical protein
VAGWPVRLVETRSRSEVVGAVRVAACPLLVLDVGDRPRPMLEDLAAAMAAAPNGLALVLDPGSHPGVALVARELGATLALTGFVPPPRVVSLLDRWLTCARRRTAADGWMVGIEPAAEPWEAWLKPNPTGPGSISTA